MNLKSSVISAGDVVFLPFTALASVWLKTVRRIGVERMPLSRSLFRRIGILPIRDHYYEPFFRGNGQPSPVRKERQLPGLDLNVQEQLRILGRFHYAGELRQLPMERGPGSAPSYYYRNSFYGPGDAEYLYSMIRLFQPARIIEIGSGMSTLMIREALAANRRQHPMASCEVTCIEPYEQPWLEQTGFRVIRTPVEQVDPSIFEQLGENDILFIDSSHVIKPGGDVLCLYQRVLPQIRPGVFVHVHDVFTPNDYSDEWMCRRMLLWNEQYLLESFLAFNRGFKVIGALNYLRHHHEEAFREKFPVFGLDPGREPGGFWMQRVSE